MLDPYKLVEEAVEDGGDLADFGDEFGKFFGEDGLHAVGESFFGLVVNFDEEAIGTDRDGGARKRQNFVTLAGAVAGIDKDRKVAAFFDGRNNGEIECVAREVGEGADSAFAEHDVVVAFGEDIFGGHEEFVESGGHAALEENGSFGTTGAFEEREVLHISGTDLDDVGVFLDEVERFVVDRFGHDAEAKLLANLREDLEAGETESLEGVRRSARLVSAAAEETNAGGLQALGDGETLLFGFNGARTGNQSDVGTANEDVARRSGNADDRIFFLDVAGDEFVGLGDGDAFDDAGHGLENAEVDGTVVAGDADGGASRTRDGMSFEAEGFDAVADGADLFFGGVGLHDDKHRRNPWSCSAKK